MDLVEQGGLGPQVRGAWISALSRLSGRDWTDLDVKDDGEVVCGMGGRAWFESNSQMWAAACGLLAMIVRSSATGDAGRGEFFCLATPYRGLDDDQRSCLKTIFKQYGEHHQFIILE